MQIGDARKTKTRAVYVRFYAAAAAAAARNIDIIATG